MVMVNSILENDPQKLAPLLVEFAKLPDEAKALEYVKAILTARPEWIQAQDLETGDTALIVAARMGRFAMVETLLQNGANPRLKNNHESNALDEALKYEAHHRIQEALIMMILESRAFSAREKDSALVDAATWMNVGGARALLKKGAGFSMVSRWFGTEKGTALAEACSHLESEEPVEEMVATFLASPRSLKILDDGWENKEFGAPIHNAVYMMNENTLHQLLAHGARVNPEQKADGTPLFQRTPLMVAAFTSNPHFIEILLKHGADATLLDHERQNALHHLAQAETASDEKENLPHLLSCFHSLIAAGADPHARNINNETPADVARSHGREQLASILSQSKAPLQESKPRRRRPA